MPVEALNGDHGYVTCIPPEAEERVLDSYPDRSRREAEYWLNEDQQSVWIERHWSRGNRHGIEREWNGEGRLCQGCPRYWVQGERVTKQQYLKAAARDSSLPPFRPQENDPDRSFPPGVAEHLRPPGTDGT